MANLYHLFLCQHQPLGEIVLFPCCYWFRDEKECKIAKIHLNFHFVRLYKARVSSLKEVLILSDMLLMQIEFIFLGWNCIHYSR